MIRKCLAVGIILLFIGTCIIPAIAQETEKPLPTTRGNWLYVGGSGPGNYTKIQDAIDDANDGDTVFVYDDSSPYDEIVHLSHSINFIGEDKNTTIIRRLQSQSHPLVSLAANNCYVSGFSLLSNPLIQNPVIEIQSDGNIVENNIVSNGDFQYNYDFATIDLFNASNNKILRNQVYDNWWGENAIVMRVGSNYNLISENNVTSHQFGVVITNSYNNVVSGNLIHGNRIGISNSGGYSSFINNTISNNVLGIECYGTYCTISYNIIQNNEDGGIKLTSWYNIISHNIFSNNTGYGLVLDGIAYNTIDHNNFSNNDNYGLYLTASAATTIHNNNFMNNGVYNAYFEQNSNRNNWNRNYWSNSLSHGLLPTIIPGKRMWGFFFSYPWFNVDWFPAHKPFDIGG